VDPLLVTLVLDEDAQERFDRLRRAHFPPDRLLVGAHVTLFHQLPGVERAAIDAALAAATERPRFDVEVAGLRLLGRGVGFVLRSAELMQLRARLAAGWSAWLTPQDRQPFRPHLTVQNKVSPERARETHARLAAGFSPDRVTALGLDLWWYRNGPWEHAARHAFPSPGGGAGS
jgi:2'-5' RNA ligase